MLPLTQWLLWLCWCVWMFLCAMLHPLDVSSAALSSSEIAWIAVQCLTLQAAALLLLIVWWAIQPTVAERWGQVVLAAVPVWFAMDVVVFRWSGQHIASPEFARLAMEHLPNLLAFFSWGMLVPLLSLVGSITAGLLVSRTISRIVAANVRALPKSAEIVLLGMLAILMAASLRSWQASNREPMLRHVTRHPWNAIALLHPEPLAVAENMLQEKTGTPTVELFTFDQAAFAEQVDNRINRLRMNVVVSAGENAPSRPHPDVLIIVCESLRNELLDPEIMPNVHSASASGWRLQQHYSGGNATSLGMFSLLSAMEAIWFYKSEIRFAPPLNRLFRQAGYELGFFAGHDDWRKFQMDAFLSPQHFDRFEIEPLDWLASDRRAIDHAASFLRKPRVNESRPPRLAILFLYSTHAPFDVAEPFATDRPAATAAYPIPFPPSWRPSVWNRYRNAARTLDAELKGLLNCDAITVLTGDHGESFLDDGTIGHGTKLSAAQTRVAAMIRGPGISPREFSAPTVHADLLPTLLAATGIRVSMPEQFDGLELGTASTQTLQSRVFSLSNLVGRDVLVVPPPGHFFGTDLSGAGFGYRMRFSLLDQTALPVGVLDHQGDLIAPPDSDVVEAWLERVAR